MTEAVDRENQMMRLGVIPRRLPPELAESLRRFTAVSPGIELSARHGNQDDLIGKLMGGELDLVIGRPAPRGQAGGRLSQRRLFIELQSVILREDDALARMRVIPLGKLAGRRLMLLEEMPISEGFFSRTPLGMVSSCPPPTRQRIFLHCIGWPGRDSVLPPAVWLWRLGFPGAWRQGRFGLPRARSESTRSGAESIRHPQRLGC